MTVLQFKKKSSSTHQNTNQVETGFTKPPPGIKAIGIDLGTTNSVVSIYTPGCKEPQTLIYGNSKLVPSVFYFDPDTKSEIIGAKAAQQMAKSPKNIVRATKRSMGSVARNFFSDTNAYSPEDAAKLILEHLTAHEALSADKAKFGGTWAVVTVPAHFDDAARRATMQAASLAGINTLRIVNEPTAAALAYSMLPDVREIQQEVVAVFDFGGGTFDVSIVEREGLVFNVLASEGDIYLGGDDIDFALADFLRQKVLPASAGQKATTDSQLFKKLAYYAEMAKIALGSDGEYKIVDTNLDDLKSSIDMVLTRDVLEEIARPYIERTISLTEKAMHAAKKRPQQISRVLLVGGSTRLGIVRHMLEAYFPQCLIDARLEPDLAVSWGAAVQAAIILGIEPNTILVDVCSHTLGIGVAQDAATVYENFNKVAKKFGVLKPVSEVHVERVLGEKMHDFNKELQGLLSVAPIIHRNSPLPARKSEFFNTLYPNQAAVQVIVVQGDGETVADNRLIGSFFFELKQPCPISTRCEIQLTYDANGLIHVLAKQLGTDNQAEAKFDSRTGKVKGWQKITPDQPKRKRNLKSPKKSEEKTIHIIPTEQVLLNSIIARAQKKLEQLGNSHIFYRKLGKALDRYKNLLLLAQNGNENDLDIDEAEQQLLIILEGLENERV